MSKLLTAFFLTAVSLALMADKLADISTALDAPSGVTFKTATGTITKETKFSNDHIGNWETGTKQAVLPAMGSYFLKMKGGSNSTKPDRANRISSSFSFTLQGAGTLTFQHRVATAWNDDVLVFYEQDIDDPILELNGEIWCKKETVDGETYFDLYAEDFWVEENIDFQSDQYSRTITVALLAPLKDEMYVPPESNEVVDNCAYLDALVWTPDEDATICGFSTDSLHGTGVFGREGMTVYLTTDYATLADEGEAGADSGEETDYHSNWLFEYWYTCDGSAPAKNGRKSFLYDDEEGIALSGNLSPGVITVRVAVYEGSTKIGEYTHDYTRKINVGTPVVTSSQLSEDGDALTFALDCTAATTSITYYYTDDGTTPNFDSKTLPDNLLTAARPGRYVVIAREQQDQSVSPLTIVVEKAAMPTVAVACDGMASDNYVCAGQCVLTATGGECHYQIDGDGEAVYDGPLALTQSATVAFWGAGLADDGRAKYRLASPRNTVTVVKEQQDDGAWVTSQVASFTPDSWNVFAVPRKLSALRAGELIAWLHPYSYNSESRAFERARSLEGGQSYLVHTSMVEERNRPEIFADAGAAAPRDGAGTRWVLAADDAQFRWDGQRWVKVPVQNDGFPGWKR